MRVLKSLMVMLGKTVKWAFIVFFVYLVTLFFRSEKIPVEWINCFAAKHLPTNVVARCESASFGFRGGLSLGGVDVRLLSCSNPELPVFAAKSIVVNLLQRRVTLVEAKFPRLHDAYYEVGPYAEPLGDGPLDFRFPTVPRFTLELERPTILGAEPNLVTARVLSRPGCLSLSAIHIDWQDGERVTTLSGVCSVDLDGRRVSGKVQGFATQAQIRPLIVALDLPTVVPYMDAFTGVTTPVPSSCSWDVSLVDNDFRLELDLRPKLGFYNGVPMSRADGVLSLHTTFPVRDGVRRMDYELTVGPLSAFDADGHPLAGRLVVHGEGAIPGSGEKDAVHLDFDAESHLSKDDALTVIDYLNGGVLDCLVCETPPKLKVRGTLAAYVAQQADNDLLGSISFEKGSLFGINLLNASSDFAYVGDKVSFFNATAHGRDGGTVSGTAQISVPELDPDRTTFSVDVTYAGGSVGELGDMLGFDPGDRNGDVECALRFTGPVATNFAEHIDGNGYIKVSNGHLAQMKLFMGLTELLAKEVPGVEKIVNQSEASATFLVEKGILRSRDILIEGSLFSISANGAYDIPRDNLDFTVRVEIMRKDSILGKYLIRPVLWPFTKLLLEFRVTGSLDDPKWDYISVLDRIM